MTKIEAGKTYRTRNGLSARILATDKKGVHSIVGLITQANGDEILYSWREDGSVFASCRSDLDLIIPTERKSVWVNWYGEMSGDGYSIRVIGSTSREEADKYAWQDRRTHVFEIITEDGKPVDVKIHEAKK